MSRLFCKSQLISKIDRYDIKIDQYHIESEWFISKKSNYNDFLDINWLFQSFNCVFQSFIRLLYQYFDQKEIETDRL